MTLHTIESMAKIIDKEMSEKFGYPPSVPGKNFGWQANLQSARAAMNIIINGCRDIEVIADNVHEGWNITAIADYQNKLDLDDPTPQEKKDRRYKLAMTTYEQLSEEEKEKDRVIARIVLKTLMEEYNYGHVSAVF